MSTNAAQTYIPIPRFEGDLRLNTRFPTFRTMTETEGLQEADIVYKEDRDHYRIDPYMNIECPEEWKSVDWYKASVHPNDYHGEIVPTNDLNLLHHGDVVLFDVPSLSLSFTLLSSRGSGEENRDVIEKINATNGKFFTLKDFVKVALKNIRSEYKRRLPKSAKMDGDTYPNEINYITVDLSSGEVELEMVY
jgi:hypothetical protein